MNQENKHIAPIELITRVLAKESSPEEIQQLDLWRKATSENEKEFQAIHKLWNISESVSTKDEIDVDKEWQIMDKAISPAKGKVISFNRILQIAASIIIVFGLSYWGIEKTNHISTKTALAEVSVVNLPDGTVINLNASSKIVYNKEFGLSNREVYLKGEGFFNVSSNKELPFIVKAQGASIQVVGTQFNVKAYKNQPEVKVTVIEGIVDLYESKEPTKKSRLIAGQTGFFSKKQKTIVKKDRKDINDLAWKTKYIRFEDTKLTDVITILNNTYHNKFELSDQMKDCTVTVEFKDKKLSSVLKVLKSTLDLEISIHKETIVISGKGCQN